MSGPIDLFKSGDSATTKTARTAKRVHPKASGYEPENVDPPSPDVDHSSEAGAFPVHCLPPVLRAIVEETSRVTLTPDALGAIVALGVLSASLGGGLLVRSGAGRVTPPNLFLLGIARSGLGKGRVFSIITRPLSDAERDAVDRWVEHEKPRVDAALRIATRRAEAKEKEAAKEKDDDARRMLAMELQRVEEEKQALERERDLAPCFTVGDVTREKLALVLSGQPGEALASFSPEARGIIGVVMGRYSGGKATDEDIYLSGYSGDSLRVDRMGRPPVLLRAPRLALLWLIQPDVARKLAEDERMTESGLIPRLLLCHVKAEPADEPEDFPEMDGAVAAAWDSMIRLLLSQYRANGEKPWIIDATPQAREVLRGFTNESKARARSGGDLQDIESYTARWGENAWRLALCLHAAVHGKEAHQFPISQETGEWAVEILRWFSRSQTDFLAVTRSDRAKLRLERISEILRSSGGSQTIRILGRSHGFDEAEVRSLAERFPTRLRVHAVKTGGRDSLTASFPNTENRKP